MYHNNLTKQIARNNYCKIDKKNCPTGRGHGLLCNSLIINVPENGAWPRPDSTSKETQINQFQLGKYSYKNNGNALNTLTLSSGNTYFCNWALNIAF